MEKIVFDNVVPQVFANQTDLQSDIWRNNATFEKDKLYLVEAESGKGKSTFCSYILGYRHDYTGKVMFDTTPTLQYKVKNWVICARTTLLTCFRSCVSSLSLRHGKTWR